MVTHIIPSPDQEKSFSFDGWSVKPNAYEIPLRVFNIVSIWNGDKQIKN